MAYVSQELKTRINVSLKKIMPKDWRWSLAVRNNSTLILTIQSAPVDLTTQLNRKSFTVNTNYDVERTLPESVRPLFQRIRAAMNDGNHDRSEPQSDYFDVGWYTQINVGKYDKPFKLKEAA